MISISQGYKILSKIIGAFIMKKNIFFFFFLFCIPSIFANVTSGSKVVKQKEDQELITSKNITIRQIGDDVLHTPVKLASFSDRDRILSCYEIMLNIQGKLGGAGIAANQCKDIEDPIQMIFIGTDDPDARAAASRRYPNSDIPNFTVLINPKIIEVSQEMYYPSFGEGCLSVVGPIRGKVKRHVAIKVEYFDLEGNYLLEEYDGFAAHVIQHECDHLKGIVFLEKIFDKLSDENFFKVVKLIDEEIVYRKQSNIENYMPDKSLPIMAFDIKIDDDVEEAIVSFEEFEKLVQKMPNETIYGMQKILLAR